MYLLLTLLQMTRHTLPSTVEMWRAEDCRRRKTQMGICVKKVEERSYFLSET
jgi:hypothetical protein